MSKKVAVFTGSFDPFHLGHQDIATRAADYFDQLIVVIGIHTSKIPVYALQDRKVMIERSLKDYDNVRVVSHEGILIDFVLELTEESCDDDIILLRGLRHEGDFRYEASLAFGNQTLSDNLIETMFLLTDPAYAHISSTMVRDIIQFKRDCSNLLPRAVNDIVEYRDENPYSCLFDKESKVLRT
jgi:pantetheine-phosphate adenylyltransferase